MLAVLGVLWIATAHASEYDYLTRKDLQRIREYMPLYRYAAECLEVPVLALPAMHYRESDLRETGKKLPEEKWIEYHRRKIPYRNLGGPFMMDRGGDGDSVVFDRNIRDFEIDVAWRFDIDPVPRVRDDLGFACLCAAAELKEKTRGNLFNRIGRVNEEVLADAFWGYNGRVRKTWRKSAYVNNHPKAGRQLIARCWAQGCVTEYRDSMPGVIVVYREIKRRL